MATIVTSQNFEVEVKSSSLPVIVDVFASWCGPCRQMAPIFDELSKELSSKYKFVKLNIDQDRDIAIQYNISSIPTFLFIKGGKMIGKETGYLSKDALKKKIESILD
ncbi:MAG: thioredoxin [Candidatus Babeliales bacterium]